MRRSIVVSGVVALSWMTSVVATSACCGSAPEARAPAPEADANGVVAKPPLRHPGNGGMAIEDAFPPERMALGHGYSIVVLTVVTTDTRDATTNGDPPKIAVRVDEVLAGEAPLGERRGQWSPPPSGVDWVGKGAAEAKAEWASRPLLAPPAGARLIVLGRDVDGEFRVSAKLRDDYSDNGKAQWVERIAKERAARNGQSP